MSMPLKNSIIVIILIGLGKVLSFVRDMFISRYYGTDAAVDAYFAAMNIPTVIYAAFVTSVLVFFIPIYVKKYEQSDRKDANLFASNLWNILVLGAILLSVAGFIFAPGLARLAAPGFDVGKMQLTTTISRIMVLSFPLTLTIILFGYLQNANQRFVFAQTPAVISALITIIGVVIFSPRFGIFALIYSGLIATGINALIQRCCCRSFYVHRWVFDPKAAEIKQTFLLAVPLFIGLMADEINIFVNGMICSTLPAGSVAYLNYALRLLQTINGIFMSGILIVLYPLLASYAASREYLKIREHAVISMRIVLICLTPVVFWLAVYHSEIIKLVFFRGNFTIEAVAQTGKVLLSYALAIIFLAYREFFNRFFFVFQDAKTPAVIGVSSVIVNIVLSVCFAKQWGVCGIGFAATITAGGTAIVQFIILRKKYSESFPVRFFDMRIAGALICGLSGMAMSAWGTERFGGGFSVIFPIICSGFIYIIILFFFRLKEIDWLIDSIKKKIISTHERMK